MGIFYCKCLACNHTGNIKTDFNKDINNFVCSRCGSKDVISAYRDFEKPIVHCPISKNDDIYTEKAYYDDWYENTIFEEERQLDKMMMAPTGWEDDKEIQDYIGLSPEDNDIFYEDDMTFQENGLIVANTSGRYATDASQSKPILVDKEVEEFLKCCKYL